MMKLLVNENVNKTIVDELRRRGHDVVSAKESFAASRQSLRPSPNALPLRPWLLGH